MGWAILTLVVVIFLAIIWPGFRYFALVVLCIGGAGLYWIIENSKKEAEGTHDEASPIAGMVAERNTHQ